MSEKDYLAQTKPINHDDSVDANIQKCLHIGSGKSFMTFAEAGSGKTYSLKKALDFLKDDYYTDFSRQGKKIAVVTFTNNAADEIKDRVEQNTIFAISTIHSFCWAAIAGFNEDIRKWYLKKLTSDIKDLEDKEKPGRAGKASDAKKRNITRLKEKNEWLKDKPRSFIYDPNGVNYSQNALSHADVLKIFSYFLREKPMMKELIVGQFPFIFIDESQDTNKDVIDAFFNLKDEKSDKVVIGLFGDTMQRIFGEGEIELGKAKPKGWETFNKEMNHRSARRIVGLGNQIRSEDDDHNQYAKDGSAEGYVRYFLLPHKQPNNELEKQDLEEKIRKDMAKITGDVGWTDIKSEETAILLLEHKMASRRLGFDKLWEELSKSPTIKSQISKGNNAELNFFSDIVYPLADASLKKRGADLMSILRENKSPLLEASLLNDNKDDPLSPARAAEQAFRGVISKDEVSFCKVLEVVAEHKLLRIPEKLQSFVPDAEENKVEKEPEEESEKKDDHSEIDAWNKALDTDFFQIRNYKDYADGKSIFRTHQGVKGNEFERVMVVMGDHEAKGFLFSYEQYFGVKKISDKSKKNLEAGKETNLDRTRRLFYVTSTRAKNSLAHVIYTSDVPKVKESLLAKKFAREDEIIEPDSLL